MAKDKKVITAKLDMDVHMMLKVLSQRYKKRENIKGRVSISDAARLFVVEHDPELASAAERMVEEQNDLASDVDGDS